MLQFNFETAKIGGTAAPSLLHIRLPNGVVESFPIDAIKRVGKRVAVVSVKDDPGLRIVRQGKSGQRTPVVKQLYYPSRGYIGELAHRTTTNTFDACRVR